MEYWTRMFRKEENVSVQNEGGGFIRTQRQRICVGTEKIGCSSGQKERACVSGREEGVCVSVQKGRVCV